MSSSLPLSATRTILVLTLLVLRPRGWSSATALGQNLKAQRAGNRRCLNQLDRHRVAKAVGLARPGTDHCVALLIMAKVFVPNGSRRHEAIGSRVAQLHEQSRAGDTGDASLEVRANTIGEEMGDRRSAVSRSANMARRSVAEICALISANAF